MAPLKVSTRQALLSRTMAPLKVSTRQLEQQDSLESVGGMSQLQLS